MYLVDVLRSLAAGMNWTLESVKEAVGMRMNAVLQLLMLMDFLFIV